MTETKRIGHILKTMANLGQAFAMTWRPKFGATEACETAWTKFFADVGEQWMISAELSGHERHLHMALITKKPMEVKKFNQAAKRKMQKHFAACEGSLWHVAYMGKRWFEGKGWEDYCLKDGAEPVCDNRQGDIRKYLWKDIPLNERRREAAWKQMEFFVRQSKELTHDTGDAYSFKDPQDCLSFLNDLAYFHKVWHPPKSNKDRNNLAVDLFRYVTCCGTGQFRHGIECEANRLTSAEYDHYQQEERRN